MGQSVKNLRCNWCDLNHEDNMQRWDANTIQTIGSKLFDKIHKRKKHSHHNNEIHL